MKKNKTSKDNTPFFLRLFFSLSWLKSSTTSEKVQAIFFHNLEKFFARFFIISPRLGTLLEWCFA
jgi:hypothetical protein